MLWGIPYWLAIVVIDLQSQVTLHELIFGCSIQPITLADTQLQMLHDQHCIYLIEVQLLDILPARK